MNESFSKNRRTVLTGVSGLLLVCAILPSSALAQSAGDVVPDRYIVTLKPGVDPVLASAQRGIGAIRHFKLVLNGYVATLPPGLARQLANAPEVESVIPDRIVEAIARPGGGGGGGSTQVIPAGVSRIGAAPGAAPGAAGYDGSGVGVAIVDTGIDFAHLDLFSTPDFPVTVGHNALIGANSTNAQDDNGHGTHVAGTIAARHNNVDVVGVAPRATLYAVKVLNAQGSGSDSEVIAGLQWVFDNAAKVSPPIRVVNMSLGRPLAIASGETWDNSVMRVPIEKLVAAGITVVVAAGNDCGAMVSAMVPATFPEVIAVGATTAKIGTSATSLAPIAMDTACYFTTDGALDANGIGVSISAPGADQENIIKGNRLQGVGILSTRLGGGTTRMSGTSMASPHVAGVVALLYSQNLALKPADVRQKLTGTGRALLIGTATRDGRTTCYSDDGVREGILSAPGALGLVTH